MTTTGSQYATSIRSGHTFTEAVFIHALAYRWLKCSFHYITFLYFSTNRIAKVVVFALKAKYFQSFYPLSVKKGQESLSLDAQVLACELQVLLATERFLLDERKIIPDRWTRADIQDVLRVSPTSDD